MAEETEMSKYFDEQEMQPREIKAKTLWEGGLKTNTLIRGFEIQSDEPLTDFGSNSNAAPAEIFLGSIGACLTSSYAWAAFVSRLRLHAITTTMNGTIEYVDGKPAFTKVQLTLKVTALSNKPDKLERCFQIARDKCLLLNTIDCEKQLELKIKISE
ncbi:MAG: OsmC family protein [Thermoplasmata archaeon]|nr:MAG: OsmC family protein [Thermoplasmata archaeon]